MSNFILLITSTYNDQERNDNNINSKVKLGNFIKENKFICFTFILLVISLIFFEIFLFIINKRLYGLISFAIYTVSFISLVPLFERSWERHWDKHNRSYELRLNLLRTILKNEFKLYEKNKVEELIKQSDLVIKSFKMSDKIFKPVVIMTKSAIFPIITFALGLMTKNATMLTKDIAVLTAAVVLTIVMLLGIFYLLKSPIESYLDSVSNNVKRLKGMLIDLRIRDFI